VLLTTNAMRAAVHPCLRPAIFEQAADNSVKAAGNRRKWEEKKQLSPRLRHSSSKNRASQKSEGMGDAWMREIAITVLCATHGRLGNSFQYMDSIVGLLCVSNTYFMHMWIFIWIFISIFVGSASLLRNIDSEILRMVVEMVREKTGVKSWRFLQVYARHVDVSNVLLIFVFCVSV
jgi:hypothetical protein